MSDAYLQIAMAFISFLGALLTYAALPWLKGKITVNQQIILSVWARAAVLAAEQIFIGPGMGQAKKNYVLEFLAARGVKVTESQLNVLIEAAVFELNNAKNKADLQEGSLMWPESDCDVCDKVKFCEMKTEGDEAPTNCPYFERGWS